MRLRQPAGVVALVALVLSAVFALASAVESPLGQGPDLGFLAPTIIEPVLLLLLTALLVSCWLGEPTRAARALTVAALIVTALLSGVTVGLGIAGVVAMPWSDEFGGTAVQYDFYRWLLPSLTVAGLSLAVQIALLRRPVAGPGPEIGPIRSEPWPEPEGEPVPDPELQPTWTTDQAVGTVWRRAGDASPSTAATDWDAPGDAGGWWSTRPDHRPMPEPRGRNES